MSRTHSNRSNPKISPFLSTGAAQPFTSNFLGIGEGKSKAAKAAAAAQAAAVEIQARQAEAMMQLAGAT